ncbi:M56 family metallopeptidase [Mucilaginibacter myungsuensis]|uniref:M48 family metalloprotease n=1 Tax=Mucilaginibacter myungsuensis TaxID=649104 RepID=A0A929PYV7_9SPHI|nr:M56 family metallopeptidase [Mucilaginibacter myungsuensis]MBE9664564.1 M48 family metalloprotease [Mucilaginibacter myungsuensis]MDN3601086.1 M56 family metallopeptidase [Mucilaginibacter myungsuensis]
MQDLLYNISQVLGITIIHSLWQGLIVFIALRLFMLAFPAASAATKYKVSYGALTATLIWFVITLFKECGKYEWLSTTKLQVSPLDLPVIMAQVKAPANRLYFTISAYMPYLTAVYVVGLVFNSLKLGLAWNSIYRIRQNISDSGYEHIVNYLAKQLNISKKVKVVFSEWVDVPCVTGFIKPMILLPVSITCKLSTDEIEAILLHELAHVKRNDYLLNFIQQVMGILLFFNPFASLIGKRINEEREHCADDVVISSTGSPLSYAQALLKLEESNQQQQWQLALAASTKKYKLLNRIERIMKTKTQTVNIRPVLITVLALTTAITSIAWLNPEIKNGKVVIKNAPAIKKVVRVLTAPEPALDTVQSVQKRKKSINISYQDGNYKQSDFRDTIINNKKYKIVIEDENGNKREYNSVSELPEKDRKEFIGKPANLMFKMDSISSMKLDNYFPSEVWEKQAALSKKMGEEMAAKMNTPEFRKLQKELATKSLAMAKQFSSPAFQKQQKALVEQSLKMAKEFSSPEFLAKITDLQKHHDSPEFKAKVEEMAKYYEGDEFKAKVKEMTKYYESPAFKKSIKDIEKYYDSPEFKKKMEAFGKQFDSPEFQKKMEEFGKKMGKQFEDMDIKFNYDNQTDTVIRQKVDRDSKGYLKRTRSVDTVQRNNINRNVKGYVKHEIDAARSRAEVDTVIRKKP